MAPGAPEPVTLFVEVGELRGDLAALDALARLALVVSRHGGRIMLRGASPELIELIELAGLSDTLPVEPPGVTPDLATLPDAPVRPRWMKPRC